MSAELFLAALLLFGGGFILGILLACKCSEKEKKEQERREE
jgi:hypothetical protein